MAKPQKIFRNVFFSVHAVGREHGSPSETVNEINKKLK